MIAETEAFLIAQCKALLGTHVRDVQSLPGDWDDEMLKRFAKAVPGVYVAFVGGERMEGGGGTEARIDSRWVLYVCTGHPTEEARRLGDAMQIGGYTLIKLLVPMLASLTMAGVGSFSLVNVQNLFTGSIERQALTVYAIVLSLPMTFELVQADALLAPFVTFDAQYDVPPFTQAQHTQWLQEIYTAGSPDARDTVTLPQP